MSLSLETASYYGMSPLQHSQSLPTPMHRRIQETSFGCSPPAPLQFPIWNITANTTTYLEIPQEVNNVLVIFDYEIRHWSKFQWTTGTDGGDSNEDSDGNGGWFSKLFGGRMLGNDTTTESESFDSAAYSLEQLESDMVTSIWNMVLSDPNMTWNNSTGECAGLIVSEENETFMNDDAKSEYNTPKSDTKLLGLRCANPSDQCTAVHGKISATYSGTNEFGISNLIIDLLRSGMENGQFITEGSPALMLEFQSAEDMSSGENSGIVVPVQTDRGTIWQEMQAEDEENDISKYGKLFVALLVVLSVGFLVATVFRRRKNKRAKESRAAEVAEEHNSNLALREEQVTEREESLPMKEVALDDEEEQSRGGEAKSVSSGWDWFGGLFSKEEPQSNDVPKVTEETTMETPPSVMDQVELDVPKCESDEVEISLSSGKKGWFSK
eukprot:CCRYP_013888-RA/>CCRYP_013888-RA protein AED:0.21 eAED:0.21 QI:0/0/0.5/1/0/0.5/2/134/438